MEATERVFVSPEDAGRALGISRTAVYELLAQGELASIRHGKRRLITRRSLEEWAERQLAAAGFGEDR